MKSRLKVYSILAILAALVLSPAPAAAQGQWEGWDLVLKDDHGWYIKLNLTPPGLVSGFAYYSGQLSYQTNDGTVCGGIASASWNFNQQKLTIMALDGCVGNYIRYDLLQGEGAARLDGFYRWMTSFDEFAIGVDVIHGGLAWQEGNSY